MIHKIEHLKSGHIASKPETENENSIRELNRDTRHSCSHLQWPLTWTSMYVFRIQNQSCPYNCHQIITPRCLLTGRKFTRSPLCFSIKKSWIFHWSFIGDQGIGDISYTNLPPSQGRQISMTYNCGRKVAVKVIQVDTIENAGTVQNSRSDFLTSTEHRWMHAMLDWIDKLAKVSWVERNQFWSAAMTLINYWWPNKYQIAFGTSNTSVAFDGTTWIQQTPRSPDMISQVGLIVRLQTSHWH